MRRTLNAAARPLPAAGQGAPPFDFSTAEPHFVFMASSGPGSGGNVLAALCSFFIPGLGQLLQGRLLAALLQFVLAAVLWIFFLGWLIHLFSVIDAALYRGR